MDPCGHTTATCLSGVPFASPYKSYSFQVARVKNELEAEDVSSRWAEAVAWALARSRMDQERRKLSRKEIGQDQVETVFRRTPATASTHVLSG